MAIDVKTMRPVLGNKSGGLSGPAIHPVAVKSVYDLYEALSIPIIGVGGIESGEDLVEIMLAGASAVQIGTAIADRGMSVFQELSFRLIEYLDSNDITLSELVGKAHEF
jgi:dihydroorotate dehydrogenase (NAD+) catalytic subunit